MCVFMCSVWCNRSTDKTRHPFPQTPNEMKQTPTDLHVKNILVRGASTSFKCVDCEKFMSGPAGLDLGQVLANYAWWVILWRGLELKFRMGSCSRIII